MRHRRKFNHLSRTSAHRKAMLSNMAASLILHKRIKTTVAKAKALRIYVEPLITKSKNDTTHARRMVFKYLQSKEAVTELFREISIKVADRPGGYTRILKIGTRLGDNAEMCLIELVDYNEHLLGEKEVKKAKTTRRGRRGGKKTVEAAKPAVETVKEEAGSQEDEAVEVVKDPQPEAAEKVEKEEKTEEEPKAEVKAEVEKEEKTEEEPKAEVKAGVEAEKKEEEPQEKPEEESKDKKSE